MTTASKLHMLSFRPDMNRLMRLATRERLLPPGDDLGYALHAIFVASFGELAPKPFALLPPGTRGREWRLFAYSPQPLDTLRAHASAFADPEFLAPLDLDTAVAKAMPCAFETGACLAFRLRVRPTVRTGKPKINADGHSDANGKAREVDAFLAAALASGSADGLNRGEVYTNWLAARLDMAGATLDTVLLDAFCRTRLMARNRSNREKTTSRIEGPDATMSGILRVTDTKAFAAGLARGIGRHRAFGFGMLLLAPPR
jgi:CRISPR system Cascade subunit CasE